MALARRFPDSTYEDQGPFDARFDWDEGGLRALAAGARVLVVVDVLSFSTAVAIAVGRGAQVRPYPARDASAVAVARAWGAALAVPRGAVSPATPFSLSPPTLHGLGAGDRLVLPSPNGGRLCALAAGSGWAVLTGCLRNAAAVARAARVLASSDPIAVIAAGERRLGGPGALRPAVEDLVGAGAILAALRPAAPSPEAAMAIAAYHAAAGNLAAFLAGCASDRELIAAGYPEDVTVAAELDVDGAAPLLVDGIFRSFAELSNPE